MTMLTYSIALLPFVRPGTAITPLATVRYDPRMKAWLLVVLAGCYADLRPGLTAPVGHGHGSVGFDIGAAAGAETGNDKIRVGLGVNVGPHASDTNGFIPIVLEGRFVGELAHVAPHRSDRILAVLHAGYGAAIGLDKMPSSAGTAPSGRVAQFFAGLGYDPHRIDHGRYAAFGLSVARFWPDDDHPFWFLGGALELSFGIDAP